MELAVRTAGEWGKEFGADYPELLPEEAAEAFRAVLHAIRDRLPLEQLASFGSALPSPVRGEFYGAWMPHARDFPPEFEEDVRARLRQEGISLNPARAIRSAWKVLARRIDHGNLEQVLHLFPKISGDRDVPYNVSA